VLLPPPSWFCHAESNDIEVMAFVVTTVVWVSVVPFDE
jgi:hypothetical protein